MSGEIDAGRELVEHAAAVLDDLGQKGAAAYCGPILADIELLAGDATAARRMLEQTCAYCEESGDLGYLATAGSELAEACWLEGDAEAAQHWASVARTHVAAKDLLAQIAWRSVSAKLLAQTGAGEEASRLSEEAAGLARTTDALNGVPGPPSLVPRF